MPDCVSHLATVQTLTLASDVQDGNFGTLTNTRDHVSIYCINLDRHTNHEQFKYKDS